MFSIRIHNSYIILMIFPRVRSCSHETFNIYAINTHRVSFNIDMSFCFLLICCKQVLSMVFTSFTWVLWMCFCFFRVFFYNLRQIFLSNLNCLKKRSRRVALLRWIWLISFNIFYLLSYWYISVTTAQKSFKAFACINNFITTSKSCSIFFKS